MNVKTHVDTKVGIRETQEVQDDPKNAIMSFKAPKTFVYKNLKKQWFFQRFWLQRPIKIATRGRSRIPKETQNILDPRKKESKFEPKKNKTLEPIFWKPL